MKSLVLLAFLSASSAFAAAHETPAQVAVSSSVPVYVQVDADYFEGSEALHETVTLTNNETGEVVTSALDLESDEDRLNYFVFDLTPGPYTLSAYTVWTSPWEGYLVPEQTLVVTGEADQHLVPVKGDSFAE